MRPAVSVVVPLYNKVRYIRRTIRSVLGQTFRDFELLVIDDGSTDGSGEAARLEADPRLRVIGQENAGESAARNRGIAAAQADLVAFLDADDEWKPQFLETIIRLKADYPGCGIYATCYEKLQPQGARSYPFLPRLAPPPWEGLITNYFRDSLTESAFCASSVAIPVAILGEIGGFPTDVRLGEDQAVWFRIALKYPIAFSHTHLGVYHHDATGRQSVTHGIRGESAVARVAQLAEQDGIIPESIAPDVAEYVAKLQILAASHCVMAGDRASALRALNTCRSTRAFRRPWLWWRFWAALPAGVPQLALRAKESIRLKR